MIVAIKDNKIVGVDKELLQTLNTNLENLSQKINIINLAFASIKDTPLIEIEGISFEVSEIDFVSLENIKLYRLKKVASQIQKVESTPEFSLETELKPQETLETQTNAPEFSLETELKPQETLETQTNAPEFSLETELKPQETPKEQPIKLYFEDEFNEIDELLELDKKEIKEKLTEELKKAAQELNIDTDTIKELFEELLKQIQENKEPFYEALQNKNYEKMHSIAHSLKGASLNLRLANLGLILKYIDEKSKDKVPIEQMEMLVNKFYNFVDKIPDNKNDIESFNQIDENIKNLILQTIENYLETNNEKQFKKDLKYIKKILKTDINSLEDLQNIIKGEK